MITLLDIIILVVAYAGVSVACDALVWLLRLVLPQRESYEGTLARGRTAVGLLLSGMLWLVAVAPGAIAAGSPP